MVFSYPPPKPAPTALVALVDDPYGFSMVDVGITPQDLVDFDQIDLQKSCDYNQFGELHNFEQGLAEFLQTVGENGRELTERVAARVAQIAHEILEATGRETAWLLLRAFTPTEAYDLPRWHMDGAYFGSDTLIYKFAVTLIGPSTLFYALPPELRRTAQKHLYDRKFMKSFCQPELTLILNRGDGMFFTAGGRGALHSEPPTHENRLFFSLVPCSSEAELSQLRSKVTEYYQLVVEKERSRKALQNQ